MLKLEYLNEFLGFGEGEKAGEYYYSQGMKKTRRGIEPRWKVVQSCDSSTAGMAGLDMINWFTERLEGANRYIYALDDANTLWKTQDILDAWSAASPVFTAVGHGNGLITDHSSSQRLLFLQDRYLGSYDGVLWRSQFKDFGWDIDSAPRPADLYEDWVVMGNSSTVSLLNVTDDSFSKASFTLPQGFVVRALKSGQNGILIGANFRNEGVLILWDAHSNRSIAPWIWTKGKINGIAKYKGAWIVSTGDEFLVTNGYSISRTYPSPDSDINDYEFGPWYPSGMTTTGNYLLVAGKEHTVTRRRRGLYVLDLRTGLWEFATVPDGATFNTLMTALFVSSLRRFYLSYDYTVAVVRNGIGRLLNDVPEFSHYISPVFGRRNNYKKTAEAIILDYTFSFSNQANALPYQEISVKLYDGSRQLWGYGQAKVGSTNRDELVVHGALLTAGHAEIGDEVTILEGLNAGETRHIIAIANPGTVTETWTMDSEFSELTEINMFFNIMPFKKIGVKTITVREIKDNRLYFPIKKSIVGRNFWVKVSQEGTTITAMRLDNIGLLYNELTLH